MKIKQNIVVLEWSGPLITGPYPFPGVSIRPMLPEDLPSVCELDKLAFEPLWHNSLEGLRSAYHQSAWSTVAELDGKLAGYQISTGMPLSGHLARLAVLPEHQGHGIGYAIVQELLMHFRKERAWRVTVNTQDDNHSSLTLYEKAGFRRTGEVFPVYII
jgi:ribosomal-protein-alanine N-acetyltransferase